MITKNVTAIEYGEAVDLNSIQSELEEVRAAVKAAKSELNKQEYKLSYLKIAEQTALAKRELEKNSQPDLGRADDWDE
jgi:hypothetical protein